MNNCVSQKEIKEEEKKLSAFVLKQPDTDVYNKCCLSKSKLDVLLGTVLGHGLDIWCSSEDLQLQDGGCSIGLNKLQCLCLS